MEPTPPTHNEQITLFTAWYTILRLKLPSQARHGGEQLESPMDAGLRLFARELSLPLSREHIEQWDLERLHTVYTHLFSLVEEAFFQRFSSTVTVPYESGARSLVRA